MALFGKKKGKPEPVNYSAGVQKPAGTQTGMDSAKGRADAALEALEAPRTIYNGPKKISPKVLEESMAKLQEELKARDAREPEHYIIEGISMKEMTRAETAFEDTVKEIREKEERTSYGRIKSADDDSIDLRVKELEEKYDYLVHGTDDVDYGFAAISPEEFQQKVDAYDLERASKRREIINSTPGLTDAQKEKIEEYLANDIESDEPVEFVDKIPELKEKDLEEIRQKLQKIYALEKGKSSQE